ncbi:Protein of unknown function [Rhizobiales bacterium GAS188]|nr:Protein of unknown function [Rhizobiales bacterium GAS188]
MSYTTAALDDFSSVDDFVSPRRSFRPVVLGAIVTALLIAAIASVIGAMAAAWMLIASLTATPDFRVETPVAGRPIILADSHATAEIAAGSAAAMPMPIDPGRASDPAIDAKPSPVAPSPVAPSPVAAPRVALVPPVTATPSVAPIPSVTATPRIAPIPPIVAASSLAPLPLVIPRSSLTPLPPVVAGPSIASLTPAIAALDPVPLPPRRPAGLAESAPVPVDTPVASAVQPSRAIARPPAGETRQQKTAASTGPVANPSQQDDRNPFQRLFDALKPSSPVPLPGIGSRTALYDIEAHTVYLPNGDRLEAHSGLGNLFDNPRYVSEKNRGATPPHAYDLELRRELFHGVAALRLNPVGGGEMFGRTGILAHTYMLGPRGDSNGCVSFKDYARFLRAFQSGEVSRLVVVTRLAAAPFSVASARH